MDAGTRPGVDARVGGTPRGPVPTDRPPALDPALRLVWNAGSAFPPGGATIAYTMQETS